VISEEYYQFESSWRGVEKKIGGIYYLKGCCGADLEDLLQETAKRAWENRISRKGDFEPWIFGIALNVFREFISRKTRKTSLTSKISNENKITPIEDKPLISVLINQILSELDEKERNCIVLYYFEEQSFEKIGERLGISTSNAHYNVEKALKRIRATLFEGSTK